MCVTMDLLVLADIITACVGSTYVFTVTLVSPIDYVAACRFGLPALDATEDEAFSTPCFAQCPTRRREASVKQCHHVQADAS